MLERNEDIYVRASLAMLYIDAPFSFRDENNYSQVFNIFNYAIIFIFKQNKNISCMISLKLENKYLKYK